MNDSERLKDLLWKERDELQTKLDRLTSVHKLDQNDKDTWPEEGVLFLMLTRDSIGIETKIITEIDAKWVAQYQDRYWSYYAPALETHFKQLTSNTMTTNQNPPLPLGCFEPLDHLPQDGALVWCVNDTYYHVEQRVHYKGNFGHNGQHPVAGGGDDHILSWSHDPLAAAQHAAWLRLTFRDYTIHPNDIKGL